MTEPLDGQHSDREVRLRFLRIDGETAAALREFWPKVEAALPSILAGFYVHVKSEPHLMRLIGSQAQRLTSAQSQHWARLFNGRFDDEYIAGVRRIGLIHDKIGLEPRWYIGGYAFVLAHLTNLAVAAYRWRPKRLAEVLGAVNAAVMLDMDFAISVYQEAVLEERSKRQRAVDGLIAAFEGNVTKALSTLSASSTEMSATAGSMAATAEETSRQAAQVVASSGQTSANVQAVAASTEEMSASIGEIGREVARSTGVASTAVAEAEVTTGEIQRLSELAQSVDSVVRIISGIAAQTNLLALNATIEAARAGDAGKGFAVVAAEVKTLANQTAKATDDIGAQIAAMQSATQASVARIETICRVIAEMSEITGVIAGSVEAQGAATREIAGNVQQAATGTGEVSASIAGVSQAAGITGASAAEVQRSATEVARQGELLRAEVDRFLNGIRAA